MECEPGLESAEGKEGIVGGFGGVGEDAVEDWRETAADEGSWVDG